MSRKYFKTWVDKLDDPAWPVLPLTHLTSTIVARDIISEGEIAAKSCNVRGRDLVYTFYGRAAYRVGADKTVPLEAFCPFCFVLKGSLIDNKTEVVPFDTGAYAGRMYKYHNGDQIDFEDFAISTDPIAINKLIAKIFGTLRRYVNSDRTSLPNADDLCAPGELDARTYLSLIRADGRNEPDDRVSSVEVAFNGAVSLAEDLIAIIVPHTLWNEHAATDWIEPLTKAGVKIRTYEFIPGKDAEHYHCLLEAEFKELLRDLKLL